MSAKLRAHEATYRAHGRMSYGLRRAREVYLLRNTISGIALVGFIVGVYTYAISAVKQETFDDIDEQVLAQSLNPKKSTPLPVAEPRTLDQERPLSVAPLGTTTPTTIPSNPIPRGVLPRMLGGRYPWLLDPVNKTLVWGAPPVEKLGRMGDVRK
ncbi:hypothetical protein EXIGLDRAFT_758469 [Exidia glandulosa HHB12029]|uniref:Cytochrome c oxidase assembly factor 3 n=1 Tax=Exidia glandulosa HHB12029 TaxID=1314781 RepID=A0A165QWN0_EXIGL|nr:hypothetical protein EXIGLDRAFT_758469 [Exidia glandulosa HHB12029]